jgi:predicted nucleotidyltransferase
MNNYQAILNRLKEELTDNRAIFVTGSVARDEATPRSDLDILVITKSDHSFEEKEVDGILVEIKRNTIQGFKEKIDKEPMNVYQWLDAKPLYDPEDLLKELKNYAQKTLESYRSSDFPRKWLESTKIKIESAHEANNQMLVGFHVSNILWKIVEGLYIINSLPTPPSSTAFRRVSDLKVIPENFNNVWTDALTGDLEKRSMATLSLIEFLLEQQL